MPPLLFIDYTNLVVKAYEEKRDSNQLSQLLLHPTTSNIRQECFNIYTERIKKGEEEENTLRAFFGVPPAGKNFAYIIERHNLDKFRPLQSLIKKEIKNPALVNVELLAWLIDFSPRPLSQAQKILRNTNEPSTLGNPATDTTQNGTGSEEEELKKKAKGGDESENPLDVPEQKPDDKKPIPQTPLGTVQKNETEKNRSKRAVLLFLAFIICAGGIYTIWQSKQDKLVMGNANTGCMYWKDDHYEEIPCNDERKGIFKLPMDTKQMKSFKRIVREDTITEKSIGKVHYFKNDNKIEYYTTDGHHPVYVTRALKPLTSYMFEKHLLKQETLIKVP
ncbi:MAG TPA: hypothetical protein VF487_08250 [Chitinophagaceae bacterium]